ncbi:uncharacterized protein LOC110646511 [Hevea brasiliensis]|uniref:uncharacterized protein LOC110646511 n=1 Tax=Hevea brasiliensis TaxID=3981 RepID=UPI0025CCE29C|nr:uncharacterized protein LOC110646511 [Hevea brasiliensis]
MDTRTSAALRDKSDNNRKDPAWKYVHLFKPPNTNDLVYVKRMGDDEDEDEIERVMKDRKNAKLKQTTINDSSKKELQEKACRDIARWMYDVAIPFNTANYPSFQVMLESVGQFGVGLKVPSYHELWVPLLNREVTDGKNSLKSYEEEWAKYGCSIDVKNSLKSYEEEWAKYGCSIMADGTVFLESVDASKYSKASEKMFELLDRIVDHVGEANVVQVVIDNASNCVLAVDGEKRLAMGYIYETMGYIYGAMDRAKEAIAKSFSEKEEKYKIVADEEIMTGLYTVLQRASTPNLRIFAIKVLSLTCSAFGCEHNWSIFEHTNNSNEWLMGQMEEELENDELVFKDDNLNWNVVAKAIGVEEDAYNIRSGKEKKYRIYNCFKIYVKA